MDERLANLEQVTTTLEANSNATRTDVERLSAIVDRLASKMTDFMQKANQVNWGWIAAGLGLVLSISGLAASPYVARIGELQGRQDRMARDMQEVAQSRWSREDHEIYRTRMDAALAALADRVMKAARHDLSMTVENMRLEFAAQNAAAQQRLKEVESKAVKNGASLRDRDSWMGDQDSSRARQDAELESLRRDVQGILKELRETTIPAGDERG